MKPIRLGDVEIHRVVEIPRSTYPTTDMLPTSSADVIARHRAGWLGAFYDADTGDLGSRIQSYVVRTPDETVLIDSCVGNGKKRENALWNMRQGTWLDDLRAAGVAPEDRVVQVAEPGWSSRFCNDANTAAKTRHAFVEQHADSGVLICAAHFPTPGYVVKRGGEHRFEATTM